MKLGERVRHRGRADGNYAYIVELFDDGRCSIDYSDGARFSGISQAALESVESEFLAREEQERKLKCQANIIDLLYAYRFEEADHAYTEQAQAWWSTAEYEYIKAYALFAKQFVETYENSSLAALDALYKNKQNIEMPMHEYMGLKTPRVQQLLLAMNVKLDEQQLAACSRPEDRLLITARAGSGKTQTLCAKAALCIRDESLHPDQVLVLAFNKAAASTVKARLEHTGYSHRNARTFHSLAYNLAKSRKKLLFDAGGEPSTREQSRFAQRLMHRILNPAFKEVMYEFFRKELEEIEDLGRDLGPTDYLAFRRSLEHVSLQGERVKSQGEKFIADFLFEHGLVYRYERPWVWRAVFLGNTVYRPDFSIVSGGRDYILEHWGLDPDEPFAEVPKHWSTSTSTYRRQIKAKRAFWQSKSVPLMETHAGMLSRGRETFERQLQAVLEANGIICKRLPQEEIIKRVFDSDFTISTMASLLLQFIQRAKKMGWTSALAADEIAAKPDPEPRARIFHQLALRAFSEYEVMLAEESAIDFDDLLRIATHEVQKNGANATIHLGEGQLLPLSDLRWVLLDEYQDFSVLYFNLLKAILTVSPRIRVVSVGDDWQAINAFAGADLRFFQNFETYFPCSAEVGLPTNYRSAQRIVQAGNRLMSGRGMPALPSRDDAGSIELSYLGKYWIEFRPGPAYEISRNADAIYLPQRADGKGPSPSMERLARALKACATKIVERPLVRVMLIARTGRIYGVDLSEFRDRLIHALSALMCK